jgi:hypothetical protein
VEVDPNAVRESGRMQAWPRPHLEGHVLHVEGDAARTGRESRSASACTIRRDVLDCATRWQAKETMR